MENRFDELAKALAGGLSRREALRRLGGGFTGALLASLGLNQAWGEGNSDCAHFCTSIYPPGPLRGQCISDAAHGTGICYQCGPAAPPGHGPLCGAPGSPVCCGPDQFCADNACFTNRCFIAGTRVTMADGMEKPIEQIRVGEPLLGPEGEVNRVVEIRRPRLGTQRLYSLNGSGHFVTAAHPFMTSEGWKAIDPAATARENPLLHVAPLRVGDLLVRMQPAQVLAVAGGVALAEPLVPALVSVPLTALEARADHPDTPLYNPRLDGSHAYFANGFLVHNK